MKKLIASVFVAVLALVTVQTQAQNLTKSGKKEIKEEHKEARKEKRKLEGEEVSTLAKDHFYTDFGQISDAKWVKGPEFDEVTFTKDGGALTAYYDYSSKLVGTTSNKKWTDLPAKAQKEIEKQYKGYVTGAIVLFDDNEANDTNMYLFGNQFEGEDHYFVTVSKDNKEIILMVKTDGEVSYFKQI